MKTHHPARVVCLSDDSAEILYLLEAQNSIVAVSDTLTRPAEAVKTKPKINMFMDPEFSELKKLKPDYIFAYSDTESDIIKNLLDAGFQVVCFNQKSLKEILQNILVIGGVVGKNEDAYALASVFEQRLYSVAKDSALLGKRPKVFFEEWMYPIITAAGWISELVDIAGGTDIFKEIRFRKASSERMVDAGEVVKRNPDMIIASWNGKKFDKKIIQKRSGWQNINAVKNDQLFEMESSIILQPGPAAITHGLDKLVDIIHNYRFR